MLIVERSSSGNGEDQSRILLDDLMNVSFCELCAVCNFGHDFLVVVSVTEHVCKAFSNFSSTTSEFTSDRNDFIQGDTPFKGRSQ